MQYAQEGEDMLGFDMPRWRFDLLHPVDIVEDLAIGHGYEDLGVDVPKAPMNAIPRPDNRAQKDSNVDARNGVHADSIFDLIK